MTEEKTLPNFTTLSLGNEPFRPEPGLQRERAGEGSASTHLRYAFLALLAANVFVISGAVCFALLYFFHHQ